MPARRQIKKLTEAGRWWAGGGGGGGGADDLADDLAAFGAPPATAPSADRRTFAVLPEAWPAVELFLRCATQWRRAGMTGIPVGLDYAAVAVVARALGHDLADPLLADLQAVEAGALAVFAAAAKGG